MHVAIVSETYPPEINGVALTVQSLVAGLTELGHRVQLLRPAPPNACTELAAVVDLQLPGMNLPRYPGLRFGLPATRRLRRFWREQRPDAIYVATEGPLGWSALRVARQLGIPASSGFHTRFDDFARHYGVGWLSPAVFAWMRYFHRRASATLVPTGELADYLRSRGFSNVQLLPRAVDTTLFNAARRDPQLRSIWGLRDNDLAVVYVGRIAAEKNLGLCVRAFRAIAKEQPGARYIWIGDGPARAALAKANPDFIFCGSQRGTALAEHFASSDLFLFGSRSETFGNVTLEAMASGVPTVAFNYGAAKAHIKDRHSGRLIDCDETDHFVEVALELARDANARHAMAVAARAAVTPLSPRAVNENFARILANLSPRRHQ